MTTILIAAALFGVAFLGLAIGVIFKRACLRGSCQGSIQAGDGSGCRCGKYNFEGKPHGKNKHPRT